MDLLANVSGAWGAVSGLLITGKVRSGARLACLPVLDQSELKGLSGAEERNEV